MTPPFSYIETAFESAGIPLTLPWLLGVVAAAIICSLCLGYLQKSVAIKSRHAVIQSYREKLTKGLYGASWNFLALRPHGDFVNFMNNEAVRAGAALMYEVLAVATAIQVFIFFILSSALSWELLTITLVYGVFISVCVWPFQKRAKALGRATTKGNKELNFHVVDFLRGLKLIKITATDRAVRKRLSTYIDFLAGVFCRSEINGAQIYFVVQAMPVVLIVLLIGIAYEYLGLSVSFILVFLLVLARIAPRVGQFQQQFQAHSLAAPSLKIIDDFLASAEEHSEASQAGQLTTPFPQTGIEFENVSFRFQEGDAFVVDGISFSVRPKEMVAIVGQSGSGKSTVIDLIAALRYPTAGRILIDGIDVEQLDIEGWRQQIGYVPQDVTIFNETVRNNLLFANPDSSEEDIWGCLKTTHMEKVVANLPQGLDTLLGEGGARLSGGQKQRLALARALIAKPNLLLLDEATSALDNESEKIVQEAIYSLAHRFTIIVVAHRLSTVEKADKLLVLHEGKIVEQGSSEDLLKADGPYSRLHNLQLS